jgi:hypothetical protein
MAIISLLGKGVPMNTEILQLTLLFAVTCTAFIGALNSRGQARVVLSYALAILTLCATVFQTSQYLVSRSSSALPEEALVVLPPPLPPPPPEPAPIVPQVDTAALEASKIQVAIGESKTELKGVLAVARRVGRNLTALNLGVVADVSDEEYESLQNKTVGYLSEARQVKEKLAPLLAKVPEPLKETADNLSKGVEALVTAAYNAERFFKAENDTEEKAHLSAFRRGNQVAAGFFKKSESELGSEDSGE